MRPIKFQAIMTFREAQLDLPGRSVRCVVISEGLGNLRDRNFYTEEAVSSMLGQINGKQAFLDHPSSEEERDRPERSVRDLCGYWMNPQLGTVQDPSTGEELAACFATLKFDESEAGNVGLALVKAALEYQKRFPGQKSEYAGLSINGGGVSHPGTVDDVPVNMVTEIREMFSADIVTKPARGGKFLALTESEKRWSRLIASARQKGWSRKQIEAAFRLVRSGKTRVRGREGRVVNRRQLRFLEQRQQTLERAARLRRSAESLLHDAGISTRGLSQRKIFREAVKLAKHLRQRRPILIFMEGYYGKPTRGKTPKKTFKEVYRGH